MSSTVCTTDTGGGIWRYDGQGTSWQHIGSPDVEPAVQLFSGDWGLIARRGFTNSNYWYHTGGNSWEDMKGPRGFASVGSDTVYASPRTDVTDMPEGVYQFDGHGGDGTPIWSQIGPPKQGCLAGKWGVVGFRGWITDDFYHYSGTPNLWELIGGPTANSDMVVGQDTVYRKGSDWAIYQYNGTGTSWTQITAPLVNHAIVMQYGLFGLVYTDFDTNSMYRYLGTPNQWLRIGPHRPYFAVTDETVYAIPMDKSGVYRYDGGTNWTNIRPGPVGDQINGPMITATD